MRLAVAGADIICAVIMTLIIVASVLDGFQKKRVNISFFINVATILFFSLIDGISYLMEGMLFPYRAEFALNLLAFIGANIVTITFADYLWALVNEKKSVKYYPVIFVAVMSLIDILIIITGAITKNLFNVEDGGIKYGPWYSFSGMLQLFAIIYMLIFLIVHRKYVDRVAFSAGIVYFVMIAASNASELVWQDASFVFPTMGTVMLLTYVYVQARDARNFKIQEKILQSLLHNDSLTGLGSRVSFNKKIESVTTSDKIWTVFCDINNLKSINANQGHKAGDEILCKFSDILKDIFSLEDIFRISGNEFSILCINPDESEMSVRVKELGDRIAANDNIASFGSCQGIGSNIYDVIKTAEDRMYIEKSRYRAGLNKED